MDRLLQRPRKKFSPSTGVSESVVVIDVDTTDFTTHHAITVTNTGTWKEFEYSESLVRQIAEKNMSSSVSEEIKTAENFMSLFTTYFSFKRLPNKSYKSSCKTC